MMERRHNTDNLYANIIGYQRWSHWLGWDCSCSSLTSSSGLDAVVVQNRKSETRDLCWKEETVVMMVLEFLLELSDEVQEMVGEFFLYVWHLFFLSHDVVTDISNAFDRVWHNNLIYELLSSGFLPFLCEIIFISFFNRSFVMTVDGSLSPSSPVNSGVPHGTGLLLSSFSLVMVSIFRTIVHFPPPLQMAKLLILLLLSDFNLFYFFVLSYCNTGVGRTTNYRRHL